MKGYIILAIIFMLIGITLLVLCYGHAKMIKDLYLKIFKKIAPPNFISTLLTISWILTLSCFVISSILLFLTFHQTTIKISRNPNNKLNSSTSVTPVKSSKTL